MARDGVTGIKRRRRDRYSNDVRNLVTASGRGRLKKDLESSTWRRDANPIRTLEDYSKPSHEGYMNTIELPVENNVPIKAISLPQDVSSTSDCCLIELENQVQHWMEAHVAPQPTQVNKITSSCEICSGPHDTQYCMEIPEQAFIEYVSSRTDKAGCKCQSNLEGLVSNFMTSQYVRLSKFKADFKKQQSEMTNKIDTVLKAITDRMTGALPSDTVKNLKLNINSITLVLSARSYPTEDPQCSTHICGLINTIRIHPKQQSNSHDDKPKENKEKEKISQEDINTNPSTPPAPSVLFITEKVLKLNSLFESLGLAPQLSNT
nr:MAK10-like protein [Tanacetum cinerariifolium]